MDEKKGKKTTHFGEEVIPEEEKEGRVREVFDSVAPKYDLMNDLMSLGTHRLWKRMVASETRLREGESAIDVAGGTADIGILLAGRVGGAGRVVVYDINGGMLLKGRKKCVDRGFLNNIKFVQGNAEAISFVDNTFHAATVGFGIRNVTHLKEALKEMTRVVKPGGRVVCLEFSHVKDPLLARLYDIYSFKFIPAVGEAVTGNRDAYVYLPESIRKFPPQEEFKAMMEEVGLFRVRYRNIMGGVAAIHTGTKV
ncbi:MAG: bifunctional demethylmenaquinone methyltransferase/2-methoxy-6-polyprenyl-1,4-benzoquinol methylase UbiE [Thermodesulfobacteriota bacterium]|nr:MAG: bifunctional demethylmenaquinone methyltransferase/2-methoxy-6-polyprenyl-1,4-benzoquinol methylase UbiE [Thermodesulfobacteriota bacterium]